jgi:DNA gyrase subunit A
MATRNGRIKRIPLPEFSSVRPSGLIAITLDSGDELGWACLTSGKDDILLVTEQGQALRFSEQQVRSMGRSAAGVTAIRLAKGDRVASMQVVEPEGQLLLVTTRGYGKRTSLSEYPSKGRATGGVRTIDKEAIQKVGTIATARVVQKADDVTIISNGGVVLRTKVKDIAQQSRSTRGVHLMHLQGSDSVASLARIAEADLLKAGADGADGSDGRKNGQPKPADQMGAGPAADEEPAAPDA